MLQLKRHELNSVKIPFNLKNEELSLVQENLEKFYVEQKWAVALRESEKEHALKMEL